MPFPFKSPTPHPDPPSDTTTTRARRITAPFTSEPYAAPFVSPWPSARPQSPTTQLRRSFRNFVSSENYARRERNETPFASGEQRDRAFEKLMRLSQGEEEIGWEIAHVPSWEWEELNGWEEGVGRRKVVEDDESEDEEGAKEAIDAARVAENNKEIVEHEVMNDVDMNEDENEETMQDTEMKDDDDEWEDISNWQTAVQSQASGSMAQLQSETNQHKSSNKGKEKADHSRKDSKECAVFDNVKQNVIEMGKGRGSSVTYIEDVSKVTKNGAGNWVQHW